LAEAARLRKDTVNPAIKEMIDTQKKRGKVNQKVTKKMSEKEAATKIQRYFKRYSLFLDVKSGRLS